MNNQKFGNVYKNMFWQCLRLKYDTFFSLIMVVGTIFQLEKYKHKKKHPCKTMIVMVITRLDNGNSLEMCGEVYGIA